MTLFNPEINSIEEDILYHETQIAEAQERLDQVKMSAAFSDTVISSLEDFFENTDPFLYEVLKGHINQMFDENKLTVNNDLKKGIIEKKEPLRKEVTPEKEFGPLSYHELTGKPDLRPPTYEDLGPNVTYSSSGRAYVGFHDWREAEEFRDSISEPAMIGEENTMNGFKYEVKFYCDREYVQEIASSLRLKDEANSTNSMSEDVEEVQTPNIEKIDGSLVYSHADSICYVAGKSKGRLDNYGVYLTKILDIGNKYTVSNKPSFFETKYELRIEGVEFDSAFHLQNFDLLKEYDHSVNKEARELWRTIRLRKYESACNPNPKLTSIEDINLGDIVYLNSIDNQYKVLQKLKYAGLPSLEVVCTFNSERPSLVGATSYLTTAYLVPSDRVQVDPSFCKGEENKEEAEVLTEDVKIYIPKPKTVEVSVFELGAGDTVHRGLGDSHYEVIGTARKDNDLYAECRLISSSTRSASIGNVYFFKDGLYLVEEEAIKPEPELCAV